MIETSTLLAEPIANGYRWTLASRLGQMLALAEHYFGSRDPQWTLLGIEFTAGGPSLWFPDHLGGATSSFNWGCGQPRTMCLAAGNLRMKFCMFFPQ